MTATRIGKCLLVTKQEDNGNYTHTMTGPTGEHTISTGSMGKKAYARVTAHWEGFLANNGVQPLECQDLTEVEANQGMRPADVLAVMGEECIVEYQMPAGTTALRILRTYQGDAGPYRSVSYTACPNKWRKAILKQSGAWAGASQSSGDILLEVD